MHDRNLDFNRKEANLRGHPEWSPFARLNVIQFGSLRKKQANNHNITSSVLALVVL